MKIFKNFKKVVKSERQILIERCNAMHLAMNTIEFNNSHDGQDLCWINPNDQDSLSAGWFNEQDLLDFLQGKGRIIKGRTDEEKQKFWDYHVFHQTYPQAWCLYWYNIKHFDAVIEWQSKRQQLSGINSRCANPLSVKETNHRIVIGKIFGEKCYQLALDLMDNGHTKESFERILSMYRHEIWGVKKTLFNLGLGYFGCSNTPQEVENLNWIAEIAEYKAIYLFFISKKIVINYEY